MIDDAVVSSLCRTAKPRVNVIRIQQIFAAQNGDIVAVMENIATAQPVSITRNCWWKTKNRYMSTTIIDENTKSTS